ncbi:hypothetical protein DMC25_12010 [Caulobacter sp. D4A]|uniref:hypothetical protein n=1 Tax=unclassified Caulobacter TaxID=2648921 RepID=UPI000D72F58F|nr:MULTISPECIES: hypothetical protein [unclassified Caulobacter]PXA87932.1 hypothetical protein DMC25_12010 [Caulobacter sp. D4A]PXA90248.1 hypothetical protein DMC18_15150 [Caulobacter sp. D5]
MPDRIFMPLCALVALAMIAFAMVWPQGYGDRSPGPFGSTPLQQTPEMKALIEKEKASARRSDERRQREADAAAAATGGLAQ